jgi:hypothetical protein
MQTKHHVLPRSRGGSDKHIVRWDNNFHQCFHFLFQNLTLDEIHEFLDTLSIPGKNYSAKDINELRKRIRRGYESHRL